jgi:hypothetical protein
VKKYQVRQEARMEFRMQDYKEEKGGKRESIVGRKWPETKRGSKLQYQGRVGLFVNSL